MTISGCSVARLSRRVWDAEVAGSNPATPTNLEIGSSKNTVNQLIFSVFCFYTFYLISNDIICAHLIRCAIRCATVHWNCSNLKEL